jgi:cbb3-type cytochrome oxidase subunit 3
LSFIGVLLLSSVAVAVAFYVLRKRPKTQSYSSAKTGINRL